MRFLILSVVAVLGFCSSSECVELLSGHQRAQLTGLSGNRELCMNLKLNGCTNVIPVQCALGDHDGTIGIFTDVYYNEGSSYVGAGNQLVELRKLDDFGIRNISFIKMDVENYEDMVLIGRETIAASRPIIFLEIQGNWEQRQAFGGDCGKKTEATISLLKEMGYGVTNFQEADYFARPIENPGK